VTNILFISCDFIEYCAQYQEHRYSFPTPHLRAATGFPGGLRDYWSQNAISAAVHFKCNCKNKKKKDVCFVNRNQKCSKFGKKDYSEYGNKQCSMFGKKTAVNASQK